MKKKGGSTGSRQAQPASGFAIILVLATLVLLALLSLTYIKLALIDRNIARNYMDNKRAKLIAQSGVDYAIARIQEDPLNTNWQDQKSITINGINTNYTETAGSTYGENRDIFKVEVRDCQSMINVNDGLDNPRVRDNTKRILNVLGDVAGIVTLGDRIINNRPPQGYTSKQELRKVLNEADFETLKDLITTHAWQDENVANPVPLSKTALSEYGTPYANYDTQIGVYRYGRGRDAFNDLISDSSYPLTLNTDGSAPLVAGVFKYAFFGLDELNPQYIEIVKRSPLNINNASRQAIIALLKDLKGFFSMGDDDFYAFTETDAYAVLTPALRPKPYSPRTDLINPFPSMNPGMNTHEGVLENLYTTYPIDQTKAAQIADEIIKCRKKESQYSDTATPLLWFRGEFKTWRQFKAFCDYLVTSLVINDPRDFYNQCGNPAGWYTFSYAKNIAKQAIADALKANFDPNLHLNELNPDANIRTLVDKTDLIVNSTEFCFTPMGYFQIESEGIILRPNVADNTVIANSKVEAVARLFDAYRETNQKQFLTHITSTDFTSSGVNLGIYNTTTNNSRTIEIGPEPSRVLPDASKENEYSGYISLPTINGSVPQGSTSPPTTATSSTTGTIAGPPITNSTFPTGDVSTTVKKQVQNDTPQKNWTTTITTTTQISTLTWTDTTTQTTTTKTDDITGAATSFNLGSPLYAHFKENFNLDYHADGQTVNVTSFNAPDKTETASGPYVYSNAYRLARSFKNSPGSFTFRAPSDLRIDGAYVERHAGLGYQYSTNIIKDKGVASYWLKPWFNPQMTSSPRTFFSITRSDLCGNNGAKFFSPRTYVNGDHNAFGCSLYVDLLFAHWFIPSDYQALSDSAFNVKEIPYPFGGYPAYAPISFLFGYRVSTSSFTATEGGYIYGYVGNGGIGVCSPTLNHKYHTPHTPQRADHLKTGQWTHVILAWDLDLVRKTDSISGKKGACYTLINNRTTEDINGSLPDDYDGLYNDIYLFLLAHGGTTYPVEALDFVNSRLLRIGEPASLTKVGDPSIKSDDYYRNWTCDSTIDEFYVFHPAGTTTTTTTATTSSSTTTTTKTEVTQTTTTITTTTEVRNQIGVLQSSTTVTEGPTTSTSSTLLSSTTSPPTTSAWVTSDSTTTGNLLDALNLAVGVYKMGRYYKPDTASLNDASYTSGQIYLSTSGNLPSSSDSLGLPAFPGLPVDPSEQKIKILGVSWTWYPEEVTSQGEDRLRDYSPVGQPGGDKEAPYKPDGDCRTIKPYFEVSLIVNDTAQTKYYSADSYSPVDELLQLNPDSSDYLRYKVRLRMENLDQLNSILLYSPVFDDITIYYTNGVKFLSYSYFD